MDGKGEGGGVGGWGLSGERVGVVLGVVGVVLLCVAGVVVVARGHGGGGGGGHEADGGGPRVTLAAPKLAPGGTYAVPGSGIRIRESVFTSGGTGASTTARLPYLSVSGLASAGMDAYVSGYLKKHATDVVKGARTDDPNPYDRTRWTGKVSVLGVNADLLSMTFVYWNELGGDGAAFSTTDNIDLRSGSPILVSTFLSAPQRLRMGEELHAHAPADFCGTLPPAQTLADSVEDQFFVLFTPGSAEFFVPTLKLGSIVACGIRTIDVPYGEMGGALPAQIEEMLAGA